MKYSFHWPNVLVSKGILPLLITLENYVHWKTTSNIKSNIKNHNVPPRSTSFSNRCLTNYPNWTSNGTEIIFMVYCSRVSALLLTIRILLIHLGHPDFAHKLQSVMRYLKVFLCLLMAENQSSNPTNLLLDVTCSFTTTMIRHFSIQTTFMHITHRLVFW